MPDVPEKPDLDVADSSAQLAPQVVSSTAATDEGVDEFATIPTPPGRRSPLVALSVIVVSGILLAHQLPDLRYALGPATPVELGDARKLDDQRLADNTFVACSGLPDYRNALLFEPKGDNYRRAFYRLLGPGSRFWVRAEQTSTRGDLSDRVVGRLRRFAALPYAAQVREYYATRVKMTRRNQVAAADAASPNAAIMIRVRSWLPRPDASSASHNAMSASGKAMNTVIAKARRRPFGSAR